MLDLQYELLLGLYQWITLSKLVVREMAARI